MSKQRPEFAATTWSDVAQSVGEYEAHYGVRLSVVLDWRPNLSTGAFVEVVIREGNTVGTGPELVRVREPFPARRMAGQAGAVMWALTCALRALDAQPWQWSHKMRREAARGV